MSSIGNLSSQSNQTISSPIMSFQSQHAVPSTAKDSLFPMHNSSQSASPVQCNSETQNSGVYYPPYQPADLDDAPTPPKHLLRYSPYSLPELSVSPSSCIVSPSSIPVPDADTQSPKEALKHALIAHLKSYLNNYVNDFMKNISMPDSTVEESQTVVEDAKELLANHTTKTEGLRDIANNDHANMVAGVEAEIGNAVRRAMSQARSELDNGEKKTASMLENAKTESESMLSSASAEIINQIEQAEAKVLKLMGKERFHCFDCRKTYSKKVYLKKHIDKEHSSPKKDVVKKVLCSRCGGYYASLATLRKHTARKHSSS